MKPNRSGSKKTYTKTWSFINYGNLFFYKDSLHNFNGVENNFFYFDYLLNSYERCPPNKKYLKMKREIGTQAKNYLSNESYLSLKQNGENKNFNQSLDSVMQILNNAILYERNNEIKYISEQKSKFEEAYKGIETEESKQIKEAFNEFESLITKTKIDETDSINYIKLINLINYILQGKKNTKALIDFESNHLDEIEARMTDINTSYEAMMGGLGLKKGYRGKDLEEYVTRMSRLHDEKIRQTYAIRPSFREKESKGGKLLRGFSRLEGLQTSDVKIGKWITETINNFLKDKDKLTIIKQKIEENPPNENPNREKAYENAAFAIRNFIIRAVTDYAKDHIAEILTDSLSDKNLDMIADELVKNHSGVLEYDITGLWDNFGIYGKQDLKFFKEYSEEEKEKIASAEGFSDTLNKLIKRLTENNKKNKEITQDEILLGQFFQITDDQGNLQTDSYMYELLRIVGMLEKGRKDINKLSKHPSFEISFLEEIEDENGEKKITEGKPVTIQLEINSSGELVLTSESETLLRNKKIGKSNLSLGDFLPKKFKNLRSFSSNLKRNVSIELRNLFIQAIKKDPSITSQKLEQLKSALLPVEVRVGGPPLSEVIEGFQQQEQDGVKSIWTGKLSVKNDFITVQIDAPVESFTINFNQELKNIVSKEKIDSINSIFSQSYQEITETVTSTIYEQMQEISKRKKFTDYNLMAEQFLDLQKKKAKALEDIKQKLDEAIEKIKDNKKLVGKRKTLVENAIEKRDKFLQQFKDSLYISSTMKTYNAYQNDVGFTGGSLGPNLDLQLNSIKQLYEQAGFSFPDSTFNWIKTAIINCSPHSVIGSQYKDKLETFLGSLAIFSLFNEGGAELQIIKDGIDVALENSSMRIMHLYRLNGLYYPGSFVLGKVKENINNIRKIMNETNKYSPNNIMIVNTINPGDIPNRDIDLRNKNYMSKLDKNPWKTVSGLGIRNNTQETNAKVNLRVVFMAGLLEIVKQLQAAANDIQLPT